MSQQWYQPLFWRCPGLGAAENNQGAVEIIDGAATALISVPALPVTVLIGLGAAKSIFDNNTLPAPTLLGLGAVENNLGTAESIGGAAWTLAYASLGDANQEAAETSS